MSYLRRLRSPCLISGLLGAFALFIYVLARVSPGGDGVLARTTAPDGTEMALVQQHNSHIGEPYTVSFFFKKPGSPWGWFYYSHEDTRWFWGSIETDGTLARIKREGNEVAQFDWSNEIFTIPGSRTIKGAQTYYPESWEPEDGIYGTGHSP